MEKKVFVHHLFLERESTFISVSHTRTEALCLFHIKTFDFGRRLCTQATLKALLPSLLCFSRHFPFCFHLGRLPAFQSDVRSSEHVLQYKFPRCFSLIFYLMISAVTQCCIRACAFLLFTRLVPYLRSGCKDYADFTPVSRISKLICIV